MLSVDNDIKSNPRGCCNLSTTRYVYHWKPDLFFKENFPRIEETLKQGFMDLPGINATLWNETRYQTIDRDLLRFNKSTKNVSNKYGAQEPPAAVGLQSGVDCYNNGLHIKDYQYRLTDFVNDNCMTNGIFLHS